MTMYHLNVCTPEEAMKLWCPHARYVPQVVIPPDPKNPESKPQLVPGRPGNGFILEGGKPTFLVTCIANKCMMWQWTPNASGSEVPAKGYCGLISK